MKFALNDKAKMFLDVFFFKFYFCSYVWMSLTCSRSFPRGVASGGSHLSYYVS